MVTVAIYGWECENERDACVEHVRAQTLQDVEILTQGDGEDSISFRNRAIAEAKGSHITFLHAKARYTFPNALQLISFAANPTVSVVVIPDGDSGSRIADNRRIGKHIADLSANIVETLPFEKFCTAKGEYVAVLRTNERYISRYSLENLVLMAAENRVAVASGTVDGGFAGDAVYLRKALEENDWDFERLRADCSTFRGVPTVRAARADEKGIPNVEYEYRLLERLELSVASSRRYYEELFRRLCFADRLDLACVFLAKLADSSLPSKELGELLSSFGYPYLEAFVSENDRRRGVLARLREFFQYGAGTHRFSFRKEAWPVAKAKARTEACGSPLLSVVMPVYNVELYLVRAIESVRKQTHEDWELICVDDGSTDDSSSILDFYASVDSRIRVFHRVNHGVSDTRNFALSMVRGKYVTFIDGDDWYEPTMIEEVVGAAEENAIDVCFFDFVCRKYDTLERTRHFWTFSNQSGNWPIGTVWNADSLDKWWWYGSFCQTVWKTAFLRERGAAFPLIPLGEDTVLMASLFPFVRRGFVINKAFYNYQRGNPTSAVSRMVRGADDGYLKKENALLDVYRNVYQKQCGESVRKKFIGRILSDICYDGKQDVRVIEWLKTTGMCGLDLENVDQRYMINQMHLSEMRGLMGHVTQVEALPCASAPRAVLKIMRDIESRRKGSRKDLYLISGQLASADDEAIDGWSFFKYLKSCGIPAKYLVWKQHRRCAEFCKDSPEDVVVINDVGNSSYELLTRHSDLFVRARAVAQEWLMPNLDIAEWLKSLKGLVYCFLQHGVMHFHPVRPIHYHWWRGFNLINFSSEYERDTVMHDISGTDFGVRGAVCGLARWDSLVDLQDRNDRVLFVMLTFRPIYKNQPEQFVKSQYCLGLRSLLSSENIQRLKRSGVRVVLGVHHAMSHVSDWAVGIDSSVEIAKSDRISYWIRRASCLITDSSSISFDFLYQDKPVVFWIPDRFDPILSVADREKMRIAEFFQYRLLPPVLSPLEAIDQVLAYAKGGFEMDEGAMERVNRFFTYRKEHCRRIYQGIEDNWSEEC